MEGRREGVKKEKESSEEREGAREMKVWSVALHKM